MLKSGAYRTASLLQPAHHSSSLAKFGAMPDTQSTPVAAFIMRLMASWEAARLDPFAASKGESVPIVALDLSGRDSLCGPLLFQRTNRVRDTLLVGRWSF
jgi:hypothetical protein